MIVNLTAVHFIFKSTTWVKKESELEAAKSLKPTASWFTSKAVEIPDLKKQVQEAFKKQNDHWNNQRSMFSSKLKGFLSKF